MYNYDNTLSVLFIFQAFFSPLTIPVTYYSTHCLQCLRTLSALYTLHFKHRIYQRPIKFPNFLEKNRTSHKLPISYYICLHTPQCNPRNCRRDVSTQLKRNRNIEFFACKASGGIGQVRSLQDPEVAQETCCTRRKACGGLR